MNSFFHWVTVYSGVLGHVMGKDRADALAVLDDDARFDRWMVEYSKKTSEPAKTGRQSISKEQYMSKFGRTYGGDE